MRFIFQSLIFLFILLIPAVSMAQEPTEHELKAIQLIEEGDSRAALKEVDKALEESPELGRLHTLRAICLSDYVKLSAEQEYITDQKLCDEILREMDLAIRYAPDDVFNYQMKGGLCLSCLRKEEARKSYLDFLERIETRKDSMIAYFGISNSYRNPEKPDSSLKYLHVCESLEPENSSILNNLGMTYMRMGDYEKAKTYLLKIKTLYGISSTVLTNLGFISLQLEEWDKAEEYFNLSISRNPNDGYAYSNRSFARMKLGRLKEALKDVNQGIELFPTNSWAFKNRALIYLEMGKDKKACEDLLQAREMGYAKQYDGEVDDLIREHCK